MSDPYNADQESFWAGTFGDEYIDRNPRTNPLSININLFTKVLNSTGPIQSAIEFGANIGVNLTVLKLLMRDITLHAVEINPRAAKILEELDCLEQVFNTSFLNFTPPRTYDMTYTKGVLIHVDPRSLPQAYAALYNASNRYVLLAEYYSRQPVVVPYRDHENRLFKRDFAGEMLDAYPDLRLVDYGFIYHRAPVFPLDDLTWFLLEKRGSGQRL